MEFSTYVAHLSIVSFAMQTLHIHWRSTVFGFLSHLANDDERTRRPISFSSVRILFQITLCFREKRRKLITRNYQSKFKFQFNCIFGVALSSLSIIPFISYYCDPSVLWLECFALQINRKQFISRRFVLCSSTHCVLSAQSASECRARETSNSFFW